LQLSSGKENLVVLDGEVAVPCNLQPAIAGSISIVRLSLRFPLKLSGVEAPI